MRIIMASMIIAVIISDAFIPEIAKILENKSIASKKLSKLFEFILLFAGLTLSSIFFYKKTIILLLFSQDYLILQSYIVLILFIILLRYIGIVPGIILTSFGKQIIRARAVVISAISSIILNVILIPIYGIKGANGVIIKPFILNIIYVLKRNFCLKSKISFLLIVSIFLLNLILQIFGILRVILFLAITIILKSNKIDCLIFINFAKN